MAAVDAGGDGGEPDAEALKGKKRQRGGGHERQDRYGSQGEILGSASPNRPGRDSHPQARRNSGQQPVMRISRTDARRQNRRKAQDQ